MKKIRWKRVLLLSLFASVISLVALYQINYVSKLSKGNYLGKDIGVIEKEFGKPRINESQSTNRIYGYFIDKENSEFFVFDKENRCIAHAQNLSKRYAAEKYKELEKELGSPVNRELNDIFFSDGTVYSLDEDSVRISRITKEYDAVLDEFEKKGIEEK